MAARRAVAGLVDLLGAGLAGGALGIVMAARAAIRLPAARAGKRLMVINSFYPLETVRARRAEQSIMARDAGGYFDHVWSVNPFVGADLADPPAGRLAVTRLAGGHTVVEARAGRYPALRRMPLLNFVIAQFALLRYLDRVVRREGVAAIQGDPYYNGLLALYLARVSGRVTEVRVWANQDAIYGAVGSLAYPRLIRWRWLERRIARCTLSRADVVVVANEDNRGFALANGARIDRTVQLGIWGMIDPINLQAPANRRPPAPDLGLAAGPFAICVSRLERVKHPEDFVRALAAARRTHPELRGVIAGEGSMREELCELSRSLGLEGSLVLAGDRDHEWVASALSHAAAIVVPLAGLALVEAALSATAVVAYDVEWHSEVIASGESGILVPYRDVEALARGVVELLERPDRAAALGARAREKILAVMAPERLLHNERHHAERLFALAQDTP